MAALQAESSGGGRTAIPGPFPRVHSDLAGHFENGSERCFGRAIPGAISPALVRHRFSWAGFIYADRSWTGPVTSHPEFRLCEPGAGGQIRPYPVAAYTPKRPGNRDRLSDADGAFHCTLRIVPELPGTWDPAAHGQLGIADCRRGR